MIMKAVCNGTPFTVEISPRAGIELGPLNMFEKGIVRAYEC